MVTLNRINCWMLNRFACFQDRHRKVLLNRGEGSRLVILLFPGYLIVKHQVKALPPDHFTVEPSTRFSSACKAHQ